MQAEESLLHNEVAMDLDNPHSSFYSICVQRVCVCVSVRRRSFFVRLLRQKDAHTCPCGTCMLQGNFEIILLFFNKTYKIWVNCESLGVHV